MTKLYKMCIYSSVGLASFLAGIVIIYAYLKIRGLRKHPGMLILWQCVAQTIIDGQWAYTAFYYWITGSEPSDIACQIQGLISLYCFIMSWNYSLCLSIEVLLTIRTPTKRNYSKLAPIYHFICNAFALAILIATLVTEAAGKSATGSCFIREGTWAVKLMVVPFAIYFPFSIFTVVYSCIEIQRSRSERLRNFLLKHCLFLVVYTLFWIPISLHIEITDDTGDNLGCFLYISIFCASASGLAINTVRLSDPVFIRYIKRKLGGLHFRHAPDLVTSILTDTQQGESGMSMVETTRMSFYESSYTHVFNTIFADTVLNMLMAFNVVFKKSNKEIDRVNFERKDSWSVDFYKQFYVYEINPDDIFRLGLDEVISVHFKKFYCKVTEWAPLVFRNLRYVEGITDDDLLRSFDVALNLPAIKKNTGNRGGRSSAFFYFSYDKKYFIKTISKQEQKVLLSLLLPEYHTHITTHPNSLIARTLGFFSLKVQGIHLRLLLMQNIFPLNSHKIAFDLKGSRLDRQSIKHSGVMSTKDLIGDCIYKDLDFLHTQKYVYLPYDDALFLKQRIYDDVQLFSKLNIMDYSLLLGIAEDPVKDWRYFMQAATSEYESGYIMGIIDYLQIYNKAKKFETFSKNLRIGIKKHEISSICSEEYRDRFLKFLDSIVSMEPNENKNSLISEITFCLCVINN
ncbi:unnamed protein product [Blepharisma stoltei]|uniref:PIPK domain-containing protein n=1 Tax=Blepharisma stoltei TaxID=1481888 RepID=A0AAU9IS47_9CILI|nr:unnamed protein product [Blepharisma stoltei]